MCAQQHEAFLLSREFGEMLGSFYLDVEFLAGVHRELVYDDLTEETVVDVGLPGGLYPAIPDALAEVAVDDASAWIKHQADGNDAERRESIYHPCVDVPQQANEPPVHPFVAVSCACPIVVHHPLTVTVLFFLFHGRGSARDFACTP